MYESLALLGHRAPDMTRDSAIAAETLRAAVVDIEAIDSESVTGNELVFPLPGGPATTIIRGRVRQRYPVSSVVSDSGNMSGGSSVDASLPSASMMPKRSNRARALDRRAVPNSARRRRHSARSSSRSRSRSSKLASGIGAVLAGAATPSACPTWTRRARAPGSRSLQRGGLDGKGPAISGPSPGCAGRI